MHNVQFSELTVVEQASESHHTTGPTLPSGRIAVLRWRKTDYNTEPQPATGGLQDRLSAAESRGPLLRGSLRQEKQQ